jgi:hypothetical protein
LVACDILIRALNAPRGLVDERENDDEDWTEGKAGRGLRTRALEGRDAQAAEMV